MSIITGCPDAEILEDPLSIIGGVIESERGYAGRRRVGTGNRYVEIWIGLRFVEGFAEWRMKQPFAYKRRGWMGRVPRGWM